MKILDEIKTIIEDKMGLPFLYASFLNLNALADDTELPFVACHRTTTGTLETEGGQLKNNIPFVIAFVDETEFDYDSLDNQEIIDEQMERAIEFMQWVENSTEIMRVGNPQYDDLYDEFDVNVTGISLRINLKERSGVIPCYKDIFDYTFAQPFG